ncbi:MAG: very short patch repair endonuclease [Thermodesulfobacteriota bacterium]|nr:very short patch repair endonuclease [Thermodesulfobacteriota bacterium]
MERKTPSFKELSPSSEASSRAKKKNRHVDTGPEIILRRELWKLGLRYRKNVKEVVGKPDIAFMREKVAVFCDGDFWHGRDWPELREKLLRRANADYWIRKIFCNIERDLEHNKILREAGWSIIRIWESDIKRDPGTAARCVRDVLQGSKQAK